MKHLKFKNLYEERKQTRPLREVQPAPAEDIERWLKQNVSDPEMRQWYREQAEKGGLVNWK